MALVSFEQEMFGFVVCVLRCVEDAVGVNRFGAGGFALVGGGYDDVDVGWWHCGGHDGGDLRSWSGEVEDSLGCWFGEVTRCGRGVGGTRPEGGPWNWVATGLA